MKAYRYLAEKGVFVTPTLNGRRIIAFLDQDTHQRDAYLAYIGPKLRKTYEWRVQRAAQADAAAIAQRHAHYGRVAAVLPLLQQAGVTILAGTDAGFLNSFNYPGAGLHDELALYVNDGLTPVQALRLQPSRVRRFGRVTPMARSRRAASPTWPCSIAIHWKTSRRLARSAVVLHGRHLEPRGARRLARTTHARVADREQAAGSPAADTVNRCPRASPPDRSHGAPG